MSKVGKISIDVEARTARFNRDINAARTHLQQNTSRMGQAMDTLKKRVNETAQAVNRFGGYAVAGAAVAMAAFVKQQIDVADKMGKLAQQTGTTSEFLSSMGLVASQTGTSLESIAKGVQRLAMNMNDMRRGTGEAQESFKLLNIDVTQTDGTLRNAEDVMKEVADRFAGMEDGADKTALAMRLFGRAGAELIPMLNQGAAGIEELQKKAQEMGLVISTETALQAAYLNDQLDLLKQSASGAGRSFALDFIPWLTEAIDVITFAKEESGTLMAAWVALGAVGSGVAGLFKSSTQAQLNAAQRSLEGLEEIYRKIQENPRLAGTVYPEMDKVIMDLEEARKKHAELVAQKEKEDAAEKRRMEESLKRSQEEAEQRRKNTEAMIAANQARMDAKAAADEAEAQAQKEKNKLLVEEEKKREEIYQWIVNSDVAIEEMRQASIEGAKESLKSLGELAEKGEKSAAELSEFQIQAYRSMQSAASDLFFKPWEDGLDGFLQKFLDTMQRIAAEWIATQAMMGLFGKEFGKGGGIGGLLGIAGAFLGGLGGAPAAPAVPASGFPGPVYVAHSGGIIGEKGMTTIAPSSYFAGAPRFHNGLAPNEFPAILQRGEGVFTPGQMARLAPAGEESQTINNYFVISSPDAEGFDRLCQRNAISIVRATNAALEKNVGRKQMRGLLGG